MRWLERCLRLEGLDPRPGEGPAPAANDPPSVLLRLEPEHPAAQQIPAAVRSEGYRLEVRQPHVVITGFGEAGLFYGACTLVQWVRLHRWAAPPEPCPAAPLELEPLELLDWPDFARRGVMLDISRDKVPTMASLEALVDLLAELKLNQLQLYMEHTFAYEGHETVWGDASPLTAAQLRRLDRRCRRRHLELVPNQNSLGHFHRWLKHEPYRQLAECPEGIEHPFCDQREPFSLCAVDPGAPALLAQLYDQLLPNFSSGLFNVGLDETLDLGRGRSAEACRQRGTVEVYLEFLQQVHQLVSDRGRRMQFWGDIILKRPDLIERLPGDVIALEWGYEADHPFEEHAPRFADSGLEFYVCPGTSSWNSLGGRVDNALGNLARAARVGFEQGAAGYLITDWGDFGHLQPLPVSYPGYLAGAAFAWNATRHTGNPSELPLEGLLDLHLLHDRQRVLGQALVELGNVHQLCGALPKNGTALFYLLRFADGSLDHPRLRGLTEQGLVRVRNQLARIRESLESFSPAARVDCRVSHELLWVTRTLDLAAHLGQQRLASGRCLTRELPPTARELLRARLAELMRGHEPVWRCRNRPGGRQDSLRWLQRVDQQLRSDVDQREHQ